MLSLVASSWLFKLNSKRILDLKGSKTRATTDPNVPTHIPEPATDIPTLLDANFIIALFDFYWLK